MLKAAQILDSCKFFTRVQGPSRQRLLDMAIVRRFGRGQLIFQEGDACPGMYVVGEGLVRVYKISRSGHKEHTLHLAHPGMTFAEVATIGEFGCPAYAEALEESVCLLLPQAPFSQMLEEDSCLPKQLLMSLSIWVKQLVDLMESIALKDARAKVASYLISVSSGEEMRLSLPKKHLASHLNLTSETLSRVFRRLNEEGLIEVSRREIHITDREGLRTAAEGEEL